MKRKSVRVAMFCVGVVIGDFGFYYFTGEPLIALVSLARTF